MDITTIILIMIALIMIAAAIAVLLFAFVRNPQQDKTIRQNIKRTPQLVAIAPAQQDKTIHQNIKDTKEPWPYVPRSVLTERERKMFRVLHETLHPHFIVLSQVDMKQVLRIKDRQNEWRWRGVISQKSLDFVVCDYDTNVIGVIELDDRSHLRTDRQRSDADKERALKDAGIRFWRLHSVPSAQQIQKVFEPYHPEISGTKTASASATAIS